MLYHTLQPSGPIPTVQNEEGIYPYESFCETAKPPNLRTFRMVSIENRWLRVTGCLISEEKSTLLSINRVGRKFCFIQVRFVLCGFCLEWLLLAAGLRSAFQSRILRCKSNPSMCPSNNWRIDFIFGAESVRSVTECIGRWSIRLVLTTDI